MNMYSNSTHGNNPNVHTVTIRGDGRHPGVTPQKPRSNRVTNP